MATIPEVREELLTIAARIVELEKELHRRPAVKKAPSRKRPVGSTNDAIRAFAAQHTDLDNHLIAVHFGVNTARVSEALAGKRV
jgi:hypothetical protein